MRNNDSDPSIERLLRDTLRRRTSGPARQCLDPDTLAAWVDGTLTPTDRAAAEAHAADCLRCQALVAAMIKTTPPPTTTSWWRAPVVTWLVPLTAAATAVIAWAVLPDRSTSRMAEQSAPVDTVSRAPEPVAPESRAAAPVSPPTEGAQRVQPARKSVSNAPSVVVAKSTRLDRQEKKDLQKSAAVALTDAAPAPAGNTGTVATAQPPVPAAGAVAAPAASPLASVAEKAAGQQPAATPPDVATAETAAQARLGEQAAAAAAVARQRNAAVASSFRASAETIILSPDPRIRWRIVAGAELQRSVDGGRSWQLQQSIGGITLVAGSSSSPTVCWLVGTGGTVILSTDGRSWRRVAFPETTDLVTVRASDAMTATVVTANGRTFTTTDGGRTWTR